MPTVSGDEQLWEFRTWWTGSKLLELLNNNFGQLMVLWAVGVGKSFAIDSTIEAAIRSGMYDLVVAFFPTRQLINERRWIIKPPFDVIVVNLKPRPRERCGKIRDRSWVMYEKQNLGTLAKVDICSGCEYSGTCGWPQQYGSGLKDAQVVFGTQTHLIRSPDFIHKIIERTGAKRPLVLLDEVDFLMVSTRRKIKRAQLTMYLDVLRDLAADGRDEFFTKYAYLIKTLLEATTDDTRDSDWVMPAPSGAWVLRVQARGFSMFDDDFHFLGYDLYHFGNSPLESREWDRQNNLVYSAVPQIPGDLMIFSGTANPELVRFRLGRECANPFADYQFTHPETVCYNLASRMGMKKYFLANMDRVLDVFAQLIAQRLKEGRRPLLIVKMCFEGQCASVIQAKLKALGVKGAQVSFGPFNPEILSNPKVIPIIHYGVIGTNLFEGFDCVYCLSGYYVNEPIVNEILQDVVASDYHIPIKVAGGGLPPRRTAKASRASDRFYDINEFAPLALQQREMNVVLQAVGRVRPYTKPREVITFQCGAHPQFPYTKEFTTLNEMRKFFQIAGARERGKTSTIEKVRAGKRAGLTPEKTAKKYRLSPRTVSRYWRN